MRFHWQEPQGRGEPGLQGCQDHPEGPCQKETGEYGEGEERN